MKQTLLSFLLFFSISNIFSQIVINEIDADQSGSDTAEFIEIKSSTPNFALDGYIIVTFNGASTDNVSYNAPIDLTGFTTNDDGLFLIANEGVEGTDIILPSNGLQNGADAVAIYNTAAANFPSGTAPVTTNLIDAIVYGTNDDDDTELLAALAETVQYNDTTTESLQLNEAGTSYINAVPTPKQPNNNPSDPSITINQPDNNQTFPPGTTSVDITFSTQNFELSGGNVVEYIINDADPVTTTTSPITLTVENGINYVVTLELKNASGSLDPIVQETIQFSVGNFEEFSSISDLRDAAEGGFYILNSEAIITFQQDFRGQKYIQDDTGAILIDDNNGVITTVYEIGDGITGIIGQLSSFNNTLQFIPTEDPGAATSTDNPITPVAVTIDELVNNFELYDTEVVVINDLTFIDGGNNFEGGEDYQVTNTNQETINIRTNFRDADYIGTTIPTEAVNITGIANKFNDIFQIIPRSIEDFESSTLSVNDFLTQNKIDLVIAPNPIRDGYLSLSSNQSAMEVEIYNLIGMQVAKGTFENEKKLDLQRLPSGTYIAKISTDGLEETFLRFLKN